MKTIGEELSDAGGVVIKNTAKIVVVGTFAFAALSLFGWWGVKKIRVKKEQKALLIANNMAEGDKSVDDELLLMGE